MEKEQILYEKFLELQQENHLKNQKKIRVGIKINALCPGTSDTPMVAEAAAKAPEHMAKIIDDIPLGRMGKAEEIASAVLYMCSDYNNFMIGHALVADGGFCVE